MTPSDKELIQKYRELMMKRIEDNAPYACMLTINFAHPYADKFLLDSMNALIKRLNRAVLGREMWRQPLAGICSVEACRDGGRLHGHLHFHLLIKPNRRLTSENAVEVLLPEVLKIVDDLKDTKKRSISNEELVKVSPYTGLGTLETYLTKEFEPDKRGVDAVDYCGDLGPKGIVGLNIPRDRMKRDLLKETTG